MSAARERATQIVNRAGLLPAGTKLADIDLRTRDTVALLLMIDAYRASHSYLSDKELFQKIRLVFGPFADLVGLCLSRLTIFNYKERLRCNGNVDGRGGPFGDVSEPAFRIFLNALIFGWSLTDAHAYAAKAARQNGWEWPSLSAMQRRGIVPGWVCGRRARRSKGAGK